MNGNILVANHDNIEYIKFIGVIRYSHCAGLEKHIEALFDESVTDPDSFNNVVIDLEEAEILDSTALGLLAKIAIEYRKNTEQKPIIFLKENELCNIIKRVCFDQVFQLVFEKQKEDSFEFKALTGTQIISDNLEKIENGSLEKDNLEQEVLTRIIQAHKNLAELSKENEYLYKDITNALK